MDSLATQAFSFSQLMIAAVAGALTACVMMGIYLMAKHDELQAKVRHAEDGHLQARRLLALHLSATGHSMPGRRPSAILAARNGFDGG